MIQEKDDQVYPFVPPGDTQIYHDSNNDLAQMIDSTQHSKSLTKFCKICDFPIIVKIVMFPCSHYLCYSCYCQSPIFCQICDQQINNTLRLNDYETFNSCEDEKCNKYFESESKYQDHMKLHFI